MNPKKRKLELLKFLKEIESGKLNLDSEEEHSLGPPRLEYISPFDRDTTNYGYLNSREFGIGLK